MTEIKNSAGNITKVFAETFEHEAFSQIKELCNFEPYLNSKIRIMPDAHAGKGCVVGTTMTIKDRVTPNLVGVDIGCGMLCIKLEQKSVDLESLDKFITTSIPSGFNVRQKPLLKFDSQKLKCSKSVDPVRARLSLGTLGGGNHFIEMNRGEDGSLYLVIHSGSRGLGVQVCNHYQNKALQIALDSNKKKDELIKTMKQEGREKEIFGTLENIKKPPFNKTLAYLEGEYFKDYIHDMSFVQTFASLNRYLMGNEIMKGLDLSPVHYFETIHNYIDVDNMILRKGAVSAQDGEKLLIPINMRDGSLICVGKGNEDWNFSAPHGAGRLMSRSKAKEMIDIEEYKSSMSDVYTSSVCQSTLDEAPQAYKPMEEIIRAIQPTVEVLEIIKPIYNFKDK